MFQVERLKVIAETIDQIAEEIEEGKVDNITELKKAVNACVVNSTALKSLLNLLNIKESEGQTDENS